MKTRRPDHIRQSSSTRSLPLSILKDTCLPLERLPALAKDDFRGPFDDENLSGEETDSGDDSGGKVAWDKLGSYE